MLKQARNRCNSPIVDVRLISRSPLNPLMLPQALKSTETSSVPLSPNVVKDSCAVLSVECCFLTPARSRSASCWLLHVECSWLHCCLDNTGSRESIQEHLLFEAILDIFPNVKLLEVNDYFLCAHIQTSTVIPKILILTFYPTCLKPRFPSSCPMNESFFKTRPGWCIVGA